MVHFDPSGLSFMYAVLAGCFLLLALRFAREVLGPVDALVRAAAALVGTGVATGAALVLVVAAVLAG